MPVMRAAVKSVREIADSVYRMGTRLPAYSRDGEPGQFVHVAVSGPTEQTRCQKADECVCDSDTAQGAVTIVFRAAGRCQSWRAGGQERRSP